MIDSLLGGSQKNCCSWYYKKGMSVSGYFEPELYLHPIRKNNGIDISIQCPSVW
jgi:hypothetical protein